MFLNSQKKTELYDTAHLLSLIKSLRKAEASRNLAQVSELFQSIWNNFDEEMELPDLIDERLKAELLRYSGFFLHYLGRAKNIISYQERGKNYLLLSVELFDNLKLNHKSGEARVMLATCYYHEGEFDECDLILSVTEKEYEYNRLHPVCLQIKCNRIMTLYKRYDYKKAIEIIEEIKIAMELSTDDWLSAKFYNQAGIIYWVARQPDQALYFYNEAIKYALKTDNLTYAGVNHNNLANLYKDHQQFSLAHYHIDMAEQYFTKLDDVYIAYAYDTRALTFLAESKFEDALRAANKSIEIYRGGQDYGGLTDGIMTRAKIYLRKKQNADALRDFVEVYDISRNQTGEFASNKYADEFSKLVYGRQFLDLESETKLFKKTLVVEALQNNDNQIVKSADQLGLKDHQTLSNILRDQFPEIYDELGFSRRTRSTDKKQKKSSADEKKVTLRKKDIRSEKKINKLKIKDVVFKFNFEDGFENFETYYCEEGLLNKQGVKSDAVIAVLTDYSASVGDDILYSYSESMKIGSIQQDNFSGLTFIDEGSGQPTLLDEIKIIGKLIGYCLFADAADQNVIEFSKFNNNL